jgi:hypothetical protein
MNARMGIGLANDQVASGAIRRGLPDSFVCGPVPQVKADVTGQNWLCRTLP